MHHDARLWLAGSKTNQLGEEFEIARLLQFWFERMYTGFDINES